MKLFAVAGALFAICATASGGINLTPERSFRELEGCKFAQLVFRDGENKITYEPPAAWEAIARDSQTLELLPPGKGNASAKIKFLPMRGTLVLDEAQLTAFRNGAGQLLPADSRIVAQPTITPNPLLIDGRPTCEVGIDFVLHAQPLRMSVLLVDLGESQLRFSLISGRDDFEALHSAFRESWYTWQWGASAETKTAAQ